MKIIFSLTAALLLAAGMSRAQPARPDGAAQKAQIRDLNQKEKAAMDAVKADATKSKPDKNAAMKHIHSDFKAKKDAIRAQMKSARNAKRADIQNKRKGGAADQAAVPAPAPAGR